MKTLAIRLDDELHAQLSVLAQLSGTSLTDEIRQALEAHLKAKRSSPELTERAKAVSEEIEHEAQVRQAAITTLFGNPEQPKEKDAKASSKRPRSSEETPESS
jgi:plasmid stability protein